MNAHGFFGEKSQKTAGRKTFIVVKRLGFADEDAVRAPGEHGVGAGAGMGAAAQDDGLPAGGLTQSRVSNYWNRWAEAVSSPAARRAAR